MSKKILIVGGVAGGASTATRARRLDEESEIIMFEKGQHVSFSNCSLPFYLSGTVKESDDLLAMTPESFKDRYNITAKVHHEVRKINPQDKTIQVKDLVNNETVTESYDYLVLSPGANPIMPNIPGIDKDNVFTVKNVNDVVDIKSYIEARGAQDITVVGGGFIGIETAENLQLAGYKVTIVEAQDQILNNFDYDMIQILHKELMDKGVNLIVSDGVASINDTNVRLSSRKEVKADAVIMAVGVRPNNELAKDAGLEIGKTGGIKVDTHYLTSDPNIYAVGDAIEVYNKLSQKQSLLSMAFPAQMQARAVANHIYGHKDKNTGVIGSSCIRVFDQNAASTGLNEKNAKDLGIQYDFSYIIAYDKVALMPDVNTIHLKVLFEVPTGRILGGQAIGKGDVTKRINTIATMITMDGSLEDLKDLELCYSPPYSTAKDPVNAAATTGLNILHGDLQQVAVYKMRELVENKEIIIDVRERDEFAAGHVKNAINIPLSEFRQSLDKIPRDKPVYLHCRSSQRSYNAYRILKNKGYRQAYNISGSYLGMSYNEYFNDKTMNREPILSEYNFD